MAEIKGAHIFSVGTWNGIHITEQTLDEIVQAFKELNAAGRVPLKFGHNDEQPITDGQPALGWVTRVWREGKRLLADFSDVPTTVFQAIKKKLYQFVSIELLRDAERDGVKYPSVLDAVALLGAEAPAVTNLDSLSALAMSRKEASLRFQARVAFTQQGKIQFSQPTGDDPEMDEKAIEAALAPMKAQLEALQQNFSKVSDANKSLSDENAKLKADIEARNKADREARINANKARFTKTVEDAVRATNITPATRDKLVQKYTKDEETILAIDFDVVEMLCKGDGSVNKDTKRQGFTRGADGSDLPEPAQQAKDEVMKQVFARKATNPNADPYTLVPEILRQNPHLAREIKAHFIVGGE